MYLEKSVEQLMERNSHGDVQSNEIDRSLDPSFSSFSLNSLLAFFNAR